MAAHPVPADDGEMQAPGPGASSSLHSCVVTNNSPQPPQQQQQDPEDELAYYTLHYKVGSILGRVFTPCGRRGRVSTFT